MMPREAAVKKEEAMQAPEGKSTTRDGIGGGG